jgi:prepilin-type N-terminal cleavage/methylation domain-containing protein
VAERARERDGFTLVELLVVVAVLGFVASALAATIVVTLRTSPASQDRIDDARAAQGLITWLPQDVDSTPVDRLSNFDTDPARVTGCSGASPGVNLLHLSWSETLAGVTTHYVADYRHVAEGTVARIDRYTCSGTSSLGAPSVVRAVTAVAALPVGWTAGSAPAAVQVTDDGTKVTQVRLSITTDTGKVVVVEAAPKNPNETLPPTTVPATTSTSTSSSTTTTVPTSSTTTPSTSSTTTTVPCVVGTITTDQTGNTVRLANKNTSPDRLARNVEVRITWSGGCQGLYLAYDSGGSGALMTQNFGVTSPTSVILVGVPAGVEYWTHDNGSSTHTLTVHDANHTNLASLGLSVQKCSTNGGCS